MARRTPELDRRGGDNPQGKYGLPYFRNADGQIERNDGRIMEQFILAEARYTMPLILVLAESEDAAD